MSRKSVIFFSCLVFSFSTNANACNIDFSIELQTFGENVTVELRNGAPGRSRPVTSQRSKGGRVSFANLCPGRYFLAIGNDDSVSVTPVRQFENDQLHEQNHFAARVWKRVQAVA